MRFLPLIALLLALGGLGNTGCATVAGREDYAAYRQVRLAEDDQTRLAAVARYLEEHPSGQWAGELRAEHEQAETSVYEEHKGTAEGLRFYLSVYPEGRFSAQARDRLAALDTVAGRRAQEAETDREVNRSRREEALQERREWASDAISFWTRTLLGIDLWGQPIGTVAEANDDFDDAFRDEPRARCSASECIKYYELEFAVPVPGRTRIERTMRLLLRLRFEGDDRRLVRAEMLMPDRGFSRWYELENVEFLETADPEQRQHSIGWALERLIPWVREQAPNAQGVDVVPEPIDPPTVDAQGQALEAEADESMVLPLALQGLRTEDGVEIVVFAAADDDEGPAYDGFFIQRVEAEDGAEGEAE